MHVYRSSEIAPRATPFTVVRGLARILASGAFAVVLTLTPMAHAQTTWPGGRWEPGPVQYGVETISSVPVPMPDGLNLDAMVSYPTDLATGQRAAGPLPVLVNYTPYAADASAATFFVQRGYITANVWSRGTRNSPGVFTRQGTQDRLDGAVVVNWAAHLDGSNGNVGLMGCSYRGNLALETAAAVGPGSPLKAIVASCAGFEGFPREIFMRGGAITRTGAAIVAAGAGYGAPPSSIAFLQALQDEVFAGGPAAYVGPFWAARGTLEDARAVVNNGVPTLLWTSWSDITQSAALNTYSAMQNVAAGGADVWAPMDPKKRASGRYQIIVGEGGHGAGLDNSIYLEWFDTFVKNQDTGIDRVATTMHLRELTRWVNARTYPLVSSYKLQYLGAPGTLSPQVPAAGGSTPFLMWDARPDQPNGMLTYTTAPYAGGILLAGGAAVTIYATSSNTNLQLIATLYDVGPSGSATFVADGVLVGSQRAIDRSKSWYDNPAWANFRDIAMRPTIAQAGDDYLVPNQPYRFDILLEPRLYPVEAGHSLRLTLTTRVPSTAACTAALSPTPCFNSAPQLATLPGGVYTILADPDHPSSLNLPLLPRFYFATARSSATPTSPNVTIPMDWGPEN